MCVCVRVRAHVCVCACSIQYFDFESYKSLDWYQNNGNHALGDMV